MLHFAKTFQKYRFIVIDARRFSHPWAYIIQSCVPKKQSILEEEK